MNRLHPWFAMRSHLSSILRFSAASISPTFAIESTRTRAP